MLIKRQKLPDMAPFLSATRQPAIVVIAAKLVLRFSTKMLDSARIRYF
jgi:hypothetical protein